MADERRFTRLLCGQIHARAEGAGDDEAAAGLAARQEGVTARRQLLDLGISEDAVAYRLAVRRFHLLFPGVYAVGHEAISPTGRALAAVMACWPRAAASHETVLGLAALIEPSAGAPHVTAVRRRAPRPGLIVHQAVLPHEDLSCEFGLPSTTLPRAFLDVAPRHDPAWVRRRIKDAEFHKLVTIDDLVEVLARHPSRRGRRALASIVAPLVDDSRLTRSELEDRFLAFCRRRRLPLPETNVRLTIDGRTYEPDAIWREERLIVELDGRDAHERALAFHEDRKRDRALIAAGWAPMRVTSSQLGHDGDAIEGDIRRTLALRADARRITRPGAG
jgi:very-short-patch-repair endonuclease